MKILVKGAASGKTFEISVLGTELEKNLLDFLTGKGLPLASSCSGAGQCKKCVFNRSLLSCDAKVKDWLGKEVVFDYL